MSNFLKEEKRQKLIDSAHELFLDKGVIATTIGEIASKAKMAKGSFYLYFKDKQDIFSAVTEQYSRKVLIQAYQQVVDSGETDFVERVIIFADSIIEFFKKNHAALRMLDRKFTWPIVQGAISATDEPIMQALAKDIQESASFKGRTEDEISQIIYVIIEMVGGICYSCILQEKPTDMDSMKPILYDIIRKSLSF